MSASGFWRPEVKSKSVERDATEEGAEVKYNAHHHLSLSRQRQLLPIYQYKDHILFLLEKHNVVVLIGGLDSFGLFPLVSCITYC
jgi:ATP-dependent RNA helicase DDX35